MSQTVKVAKFKGNTLDSSGNIILDFGIENDYGMVYNGAWSFTLLEFNLPYMKIEVHHPRGNYVQEHHHVVAVK